MENQTQSFSGMDLQNGDITKFILRGGYRWGHGGTQGRELEEEDRGEGSSNQLMVVTNDADRDRYERIVSQEDFVGLQEEIENPDGHETSDYSNSVGETTRSGESETFEDERQAREAIRKGKQPVRNNAENQEDKGAEVHGAVENAGVEVLRTNYRSIQEDDDDEEWNSINRDINAAREEQAGEARAETLYCKLTRMIDEADHPFESRQPALWDLVRNDPDLSQRQPIVRQKITDLQLQLGKVHDEQTMAFMRGETRRETIALIDDHARALQKEVVDWSKYYLRLLKLKLV